VTGPRGPHPTAGGARRGPLVCFAPAPPHTSVNPRGKNFSRPPAKFNLLRSSARGLWVKYAIFLGRGVLGGGRGGFIVCGGRGGGGLGCSIGRTRRPDLFLFCGGTTRTNGKKKRAEKKGEKGGRNRKGKGREPTGGRGNSPPPNVTDLPIVFFFGFAGRHGGEGKGGEGKRMAR